MGSNVFVDGGWRDCDARWVTVWCFGGLMAMQLDAHGKENIRISFEILWTRTL